MQPPAIRPAQANHTDFSALDETTVSAACTPGRTTVFIAPFLGDVAIQDTLNDRSPVHLCWLVPLAEMPLWDAGAPTARASGVRIHPGSKTALHLTGLAPGRDGLQ